MGERLFFSCADFSFIMNKTSRDVDIIKIDRSPKDESCYICGRTPKEIDAFLDFPEIQKDISDAIDKRNRRIKADMKSYSTDLKKLLADTKLYPGDFTTKELRQDEEAATKDAPRLAELLVYAPGKSGTSSTRLEVEHDATVDESRKNLEALAGELDREDYARIPGYNREFAARLQYLKNFDGPAFKPARTRFDTTMMRVTCDLRGERLSTSQSFPHNELQYKREDAEVPTSPGEVVEITYQLPVCPFCSKLLDDASRAAYKTIHAQDYCEDD
jgi:hypothetical protein